jgi:uncharacterized protein
MWQDKPLCGPLVDLLRREGLHATTVLRAVRDSGSSNLHPGSYHTPEILPISQDLALVVEVVAYPDQIEKILPNVEEMIGVGRLITLEKVHPLSVS